MGGLVNANSRFIPLRDKSIQCVITSPPYFNLRSYGVGKDGGELGLEKTPEEFVDNMVMVFREVWRVLRDDGTLWLNLGDSYYGANWRGSTAVGTKQATNRGATGAQCTLDPKWLKQHKHEYLKPTDLMCIPWLVAIALQRDGWYLRSDIVYAKRNPMPESVTSRPTRSHEYVFLLTKNRKYYYNSKAIMEPAGSNKWPGIGPGHGAVRDRGEKYEDMQVHSMRNKRDVWFLSTSSYTGAHFAVFPTSLVIPMVLAGSRPGDIVLDIFCGSGTVGEVCRKLDREFVGLDLNFEYLQRLALPRAMGKTSDTALKELPMFKDIV